jgi:RimJ/RimL family protein N-acetyltransferase
MFSPDLLLETNKITLRLLTKEDFPAFQKETGNPDEWEYFTANLADPKECKLWLDEALQQYGAGLKFPFVIINREIDQIIGSTSYGNISLRDKRLEIGWTWLGKNFRGKGFNPHIKYLMLQYAYESMGFERVEFKTDVMNQASRKALTKIGAIEEGILRSHTLMQNNRRRDTIYYSILKSEWEDVKSNLLLQIRSHCL